MDHILNKLPLLNSEGQGWPWIEDTPIKPDPAKHYPKISIVTPSYNQGDYLEKTLRSVLLQNYPNLEFFVFDGNSQDQSVDILKAYSPWLTYWESKPDKGQTEAINKGMKRVSGDIIAYINSDDYYNPGTFFRIAEEFQKGHDWLVGAANFIYVAENNSVVWMPDKTTSPNNYLSWLARAGGIAQPSVFWSKRIKERYGLFHEHMHYCFDTEFWIRLLYNGEKIHFVEEVFSNLLYHEEAKSVADIDKFQVEFDTYVLSQYDLTPAEKKYMRKEKTRAEVRKLGKEGVFALFHEKNFLRFFKSLIKGGLRSPLYMSWYYLFLLSKKFSPPQ